MREAPQDQAEYCSLVCMTRAGDEITAVCGSDSRHEKDRRRVDALPSSQRILGQAPARFHSHLIKPANATTVHTRASGICTNAA